MKRHSMRDHGATALDYIGMAFLVCWLIATGVIAAVARKIPLR
jgi:hypothetical protein